MIQQAKKTGSGYETRSMVVRQSYLQSSSFIVTLEGLTTNHFRCHKLNFIFVVKLIIEFNQMIYNL